MAAAANYQHFCRRQRPYLMVPLGCVQFAPLSTGRAKITYCSGRVPVPLLQAPLHGPAVTQVALQATGLQGFLLVHSVTMRVSPALAGQAVPLRAAGVVMTYLQNSRDYYFTFHAQPQQGMGAS
jgi:hypothetical protein